MPRYLYQCLVTSWAGVAVLALAVPGVLAEPLSRGYLMAVSPDEGAARETSRQRGWLGVSGERSENIGSRSSYWLDAWPSLGFSTDSKGRADRTNDVLGDQVSGSRPSSLDLVPGYKLYSGQVMYRLLPDIDDGEGDSARFYPYVGLGAGVIRPDFESLTGRVSTDGKGIAGTSVRGLAGLNFQLNRRTSFYGEYSLDYLDDSLRTSDVSPGLPSTASRVMFGLRYGFE